jgi:hypothetical protein
MSKNKLCLALAMAGLLAGGAANAVTLEMVPGTSSPQPGTTVNGVQLTAASTAGSRGWNATFDVPAGMTLTGVTPNATVLGAFGACSFDAMTSRLVVLAGNLNTDLASGTACTFNLVIDGGVAIGAVLPITVFGVPGCTVTSGGGTCTTTVTDRDAGTAGTQAHVATTSNAPIARTLSYNPTAGSTVNFAAGGPPGSAAPDQTITVTANGNTGTATLSGCAISGAGASSFDLSPTSLTFNDGNPGPGALTLGCTYPTSTASATLTCTETDGDTVAPGAARTFNLSCPAPTVNPTIASAPASGSTINVSGGIAGTQGVGLVDFSASGGSGAGSTAISCTSTGNVQIANSPATPSGQGPVNQTVTGTNAPIDLRVGVQLTTNAQSPAGTVTCTAAGQADFTFNVNAPAGTTVVPPTFIPSSSTWSTIALLSLLGVFGLLAVGFRRQS